MAKTAKGFIWILRPNTEPPKGLVDIKNLYGNRALLIESDITDFLYNSAEYHQIDLQQLLSGRIEFQTNIDWQEHLRSWARTGVQYPHLILGSLFFLTGDMKSAEEIFEEAKSKGIHENNNKLVDHALYYLAQIEAKRGNHESSYAFFNDYYERTKDIGKPTHLSAILNERAQANKEMGLYDLARADYLKSLRIDSNIRELSTAAETMVNLADLYDRMGLKQKAIFWYHHAIKRAEERGALQTLVELRR